MVLQIEVARDVLSTSDATIIGVLLAVIVILLTAIGMLWRKIEKQDTYIKAQDKANLEMLLTVTSTVNGFGKDISGIESVTNDTNRKADTLLTMINERLKIYRNGNT